MSERAAWGRSCRALGLALGCAALSPGCASDGTFGDMAIGSTDPYELGGQTGSLLPSCGVAPLSAEGQSVAAGRDLAVFYAKDCPELARDGRLALLGAGGEGLPIELVSLGADAYLLQAAQSVPAGDYQLQLGAQQSSALSVSAAEPAVPSSFGTLSSVTAAQCPELLRFTLELDDATLALAPLARFEVSIDGGAEQLWVDYGALPIERDDTGSRGVLELPMCGEQGCIGPGPHHLQLRVRLAGQSREPERIEHDFEPCPPPAAAGSSGEGCTMGAPGRPRSWVLGLAGLVAALGLCARRLRPRSGGQQEQSES